MKAIRRQFMKWPLTSVISGALIACTTCLATAQTPIKIGVIQSMTGPQTSIGRDAVAAVQLYMEQHGASVAGRELKLIVKDDTGSPDTGRRLAQELIVNQKVDVLLVGITPVAFAIAPLSAEAKIPMISLVAGASILVERSPYVVRTGFAISQPTTVMADCWRRTAP